MAQKKVTIYTDGAASGNPGRAGWGAVFLTDSGVFELGGNNPHATNNQMELTAPIEALKHLQKVFGGGITSEITREVPRDLEVEIVSDSKYVILGITEWIGNWIKNGWRNAAKKPVLNKELWQELYKLNEEFKPKWSYVEGHNGHEHNERADVIATSFGYGEPVELKKL